MGVLKCAEGYVMTDVPGGNILIVDPDAASLQALMALLHDQGYLTETAESGAAALAVLQRHPVDLLLADLTLADMDGIALLTKALAIDTQLVGVLMTREGSIESAVDAMRAGALDYVLKPIDPGTLLPVLARAMRMRALRLENVELRDTVAIHELTQAIAHTLDPMDLMERIVDASMEEFEADEVSVMLLSADGKSLHVAAAGGARRDKALGTRVAIGEGIAGHVAAIREPLALHGKIRDDTVIPAYLRTGIQSAVSIPMIARNELVGVLNIAYTSQPRSILPGQMRVLSIFVNAAAATIQAARLHDEQRRADLRYRDVLAIAADGIISIDQEQRVVLFTGEAERIFGYTPEEVLGQPLDLLLPPELAEPAISRASWAMGEDGLPHGGAERLRAVARRKDGSLLHVEVGLSAPSGSGEQLRTAVVRDMTARVEQEERIVRLNEELNQAQRMETLGRFAGGVAHDFNNLLTAIIGGCELAQAEVDPDSTAAEDIREIANAGKRASELTRQLLAFSRRQIVMPHALDLNVQLRTLEGVLRRVVPEDIALSLQLSDDLWPIRIDASQLDQLVLNLAVNARDAMPGNGVLTLRTANVTIRGDDQPTTDAVAPGDYVRFSVTDTGHGMSADTVEHVFEPFFTTKAADQGTGLGLASVHGILRQHSASIHVDSELGIGTTFVIHFSRHHGVVETPSVPSARGVPGGNETVLLVDDDAHVRRVTVRLLQRLGYRVLECDGPMAALATCARHDGDLHLLITDIVMPDMNGLVMAEQARRLRPNLCTLFMSGYAPEAMRHGVVLGPGMHHIEKPYELDAFARAVRRALADRSAAAA